MIFNPSLSFAGASLHPLASIPALSSLPGAPATLYLDFDGHFQATYDTYSNIVTSAYDSDGDPTTFTDAELSYITTLWSDVVEDFAPFNINVTTVEPAVLAAGAPESAANGVALRVAMGQSTGDNGFGNPSGGWAYFNAFTNSIANVAYAFVTATSTPITYASIASHEAGHAFGLQHQVGDYFDFQTRSSALMGGATLGFEHTYWHNGLIEDGTQQDDMARIARSVNGFGYRADDHGNTIAAATPLTGVGSGYTATGIIGSNTDVDVFSLSLATPGSFQISLEGHSPGQNLDAVLELRDSSGDLVLMANPEDSLDASLVGSIAETGYIAVRSTGQYGRIGQYTLTMTPTTLGVPATPGDFDNDGAVDGRDFLAWQRNPSVGDLADWQANYGTSAVSSSTTVAVVPEPASAVLMLLLVLLAGVPRTPGTRTAWRSG